MEEKTTRSCTSVEALLETMNLTAEERELHKALISECMQNERNIAECAAVTKNNMERITTVLGQIYNNMVAMETALDNLAKGAEEFSLRMLPADKFYRE